MTAQIVSNEQLQATAAFVRDALQLASAVQLFRNDTPLTPATLLANLLEPDHAEYESKSLAGKWSIPRKVREGLWYIEADEQTWVPPLLGNYSAFGYVVVGAVGKVVMQRFPAEVTLESGGLSFFLTVRVYFSSLSEVCEEPDLF